MCSTSHFISFKYSEQVVALLSLALQFQPGAYCTRCQEGREGADGRRIPRKEQADVLCHGVVFTLQEAWYRLRHPRPN